MPRIKSDDYSNHNLPIGAVVEPLPRDQYPDYADDYADEGVVYYTQGGVGDEIAIDPRDLED